MGLVTLPDSLISSSSSINFFPSAFFEVFSYRFASSCPEFYSGNVFSVIVVLIAASCTEMVSGGASLSRLESLHDTKRGSGAHEYF